MGGLCPSCIARQLVGPGSAATLAGPATNGADQESRAESLREAAQELAPGQRIDRYRLEEKIGEGGFAVVFRAQQEEPVQRPVALKVIKQGMDTRQVVARFDAERQALAPMDHAHIARVLDGGTTSGGRAYFVMELVPGIPITEYCDAHRLTTEERLRLFVTVCEAVQHAHQKGIIHRDLKPSNILVSAPTNPKVALPGGTSGFLGKAPGPDAGRASPKVIDFGIAKATSMELTNHMVFTQLHQFVGTPAYMSPEQWEISAADVDTRSDTYSLGVLLYQLLIGRTPFEERDLVRGDYYELRRMILEKDPVRPSTRLSTLLGEELEALARRHRTDASKLARVIRGDLDWIVMRCLEKDRARRYETAHELARDIERYLRTEPVVARPPSLGYRTQRFVRRNRWAVAGAATLAVVLVLATLLTSIGFVGANRQRKRADREAQNAFRLSYGANLRSAMYLRESLGNGGRAMQALTNCPVELRDWEWHYLRAKCDQTHRLIAAGLDNVQNAFFTPDGTKVLSGRLSGLYQLWDFQSGRELAQFQMKPGRPGDHPSLWAQLHGPRFTPDGEKVILFDPTQIVVWQLATGEPLQTFTNLRPMAVHAGNHELLSLGWREDDPTNAVIWDHVSNQLRMRLPASLSSGLSGFERLIPEDAFGVMFTPNGKELILGLGGGTLMSKDTWIEIWNARSGHRVSRFSTAHMFPMYDADLNPKHHLLATISTDCYAKVFDLNAPESAGPAHVFFGEESLWAVALSHDGRRLAAGGSRSEILIWDLTSTSTNQEPDRLSGHASQIRSLQFSPDDRWILSSSGDGTVRAWESESFRPASFYLIYQLARDAIFSPNGRFLVSIGHNGVGNSRDANNRQWGVVKLWDADTGQELATLGEPGVVVQDVAFSSDGSRLAMLEWATGRATIWDASSWQQVLALEKIPGKVNQIYFIGHTLAACGGGSRVYLWDTLEGALGSQYSLSASTGADVDASTLSPDGSLLAVSLDEARGEVRLHEALHGNLRQTLRGPVATVNALAFSPDASRLAAGLSDTTIAVWELPSGRLIHRLRGHTEPVKTVAFSPSGRRLLTGGADDSLRIWKFDTEEELLSLPMPEGGDITHIRFSPDGRTIVAMNIFWPPWCFQSFQPSEKQRRSRRLVYLATEKVWKLTEELQSPEQMFEALRGDSGLEPEIKSMALDIVRTRLSGASDPGQP